MKFAEKYNVTLVLKSSSTIITDGERLCIQPEGSTALAKAGSGDSLSGVICGLLAYLKNEDIYKISSLGSFLLGYTAKVLSNKIPEENITISDIINEMPTVFKKLK